MNFYIFGSLAPIIAPLFYPLATTRLHTLRIAQHLL
jgi:hypothetical protein